MPDREQRVREIAHRLWEQEGRPSDQDQRHWATAERIYDERARAASEADLAREQGQKARPAGTSKRSTGRRTSKRTTAGPDAGVTTSH